ncbi:G5 domain-containing protein [Jeotgalibacillus soli]|uniref:G5 domain-containing protein n=1 Tax=Jeotgalibacillus soli TaxID=889306 RepID=A0A0C2RS50_9BACL|nr:G5 domain-containing protein [Jeotgalibacillus soli]KIL44569.1 hypothetical protein KP78_35330 [Jeotgalibacillus soli]
MKKWYKLAVVLMLLLTLSYVAVIKLVAVFPVSATESDFTYINGGVIIPASSVDEVRSYLMSEISAWQSGRDLELSYSGGDVTIPREVFVFDLEQTIQMNKDKIEAPWYSFKSRNEEKKIMLTVYLDDTKMLEPLFSIIEIKKTIAQLEFAAGSLSNETIQAVEKKNASSVGEIVATHSVDVPYDDPALIKLVSLFDGVQIHARSNFSMLEWLKENGDDSSILNILASGLYGGALQTNLKILERHAQSAIPSYTDPGMEAEISPITQRDLRLHNPNPFPLTIQAVINDSRLVMTFSSLPLDAAYQVKVVEDTEVEPRIIRRFTNNLQAGEEQLIQQGVNGQRVETIRLMVSSNGETLSSDRISRDFYAPVPTVIEVSSYTKEQELEQEIRVLSDQSNELVDSENMEIPSDKAFNDQEVGPGTKETPDRVISSDSK